MYNAEVTPRPSEMFRIGKLNHVLSHVFDDRLIKLEQMTLKPEIFQQNAHLWLTINEKPFRLLHFELHRI